MKPDKLWGVIEHYKSELIRLGVVAKQMTADQYDSREAGQDVKVMLPHCAWMLNHCLTVFKPAYAEASVNCMAASQSRALELYEAAHEEKEKAMRWMAYVQGVLNSFGVYSCNHLRDHSRAAQKC